LQRRRPQQGAGGRPPIAPLQKDNGTGGGVTHPELQMILPTCENNRTAAHLVTTLLYKKKGGDLLKSAAGEWVELYCTRGGRVAVVVVVCVHARTQEPVGFCVFGRLLSCVGLCDKSGFVFALCWLWLWGTRGVLVVGHYSNNTTTASPTQKGGSPPYTHNTPINTHADNKQTHKPKVAQAVAPGPGPGGAARSGGGGPRQRQRRRGRRR
jgi:hypothetical protein